MLREEHLRAKRGRRRREMLEDIVTDGLNKLNGILRLSKANERLRCNRKVSKQANAHVKVIKSVYHRYIVNVGAKRTIFERYSVGVVQPHKNLSR